MKRIILILFVSAIAGINGAKAQKVLTLRECYDKAMISNPVAGEKEAYSSVYELNDKNLSKTWLPTVDANGSFLYNSSVVDLRYLFESLPIPGLADAAPLMPHDQYKLTLDINQVIYDGGAIKNAKNLEKVNLSINQKQTDTDLYKLRGQINTTYFNLLLLEKQKELVNSFLDLINKQIISLQSAYDNGTITRADIDVMTSEKIKLEQQLTGNEILRSSMLKILSSLTGEEIDSSTQLAIPVSSDEITQELSRPELEMFDLKKEQLDAGLKALQSQRLPKAIGFASLGYGNPAGSDFFRDQFDTYYVLGASIKWNIFDWNETKNEKQAISFQRSIIENRKIDLVDNLNRMLQAKNAEIVNLKNMLESDTVLIDIRKRITASAESQYKNGNITATELLNEMNSERQSMINYELHKINLAMAKIEYLNISGKEIE
jgi:outer membrane protein TolC